MFLSFVDKWPMPLQLLAFVVALVVGIIFLVKFCDIFVAASSAIAKKLHISPLVIGLTIVAMGTSCPELAVSVSDSITTLVDGGNANVAIGNVVGSNICNLLIVIGFSAIFTPLIVKKSVCKKEYPFMILVTSLLVVFGCFFSLSGQHAILRWEAIILVVFSVIYLLFLLYNAKKNPEEQGEVSEVEDMVTWKAILFVILGIAGIVLGGEAVVFGAKGLALSASDALSLNHDLAEALVGLTIVAVGTSLPELVTSVVAARKGENEIALGNVIGSNIFNIVFVLGISGTVTPLTTGSQIIVDLLVMLGATLIVFFVALKGKIEKKHGYLFIVLYGLYLLYLIIRTITAGV